MDAQTPYEPVGSYLLLKQEILPEKSEGGIFIPEAYRRDMNEGIILKKGPDVSPEFNEGDTVIFTRNSEYQLSEEEKSKDTNFIFTAVQESNIILRKPYKPAIVVQKTERGFAKNN